MPNAKSVWITEITDPELGLGFCFSKSKRQARQHRRDEIRRGRKSCDVRIYLVAFSELDALVSGRTRSAKRQ